MSETVHASTVAIGGYAVMLEGPSGAGKSDLALRLIDRGAVLVSDDYTVLARSGDTLLASAPPTIAGRIEVRGVGILPIAHVAQAPVALLVRLSAEVDRLPDAAIRIIAGVPIREIVLDPNQHSAAIKVELALHHLLHVAP
ncbi:MAG: HPr kinase/phosphatase C-terminal domain-containing protein [Sphingomonas sp.]